jgi:hypothetical protein
MIIRITLGLISLVLFWYAYKLGVEKRNLYSDSDMYIERNTNTRIQISVVTAGVIASLFSFFASDETLSELVASFGKLF